MICSRLKLRWVLVLVGTVLLVMLAVITARAELEPVVWLPPPNPGLVGEFAPNTYLDDAELLLPGAGFGPEDVARGPDGALYTGFEDGRIVRFADGQQVTFADTGGRPLGLQFDRHGHLLVADGERGLLSVTPAADVSVLVDRLGGERLLLVDDLDIAADGTIWFSDASQRFGLDDSLLDLLEASASGRLLSYDPATAVVTVHLDGLYFANGVALGPRDEFVLVNETGAGRIRRLWLKGERAGHSEVFIEALPGHVDNISFNGDDLFWVALPALRKPVLDAMAPWPWLRKCVAALPDSVLLPTEGGYGFVLGLDLNGVVRHNLQGPQGRYHTITSVNEWQGQLYLGSLSMPAVGRIDRP